MDATSTYGDGVAGTNSSDPISAQVRQPAGVRGTGSNGALGVAAASDSGTALEAVSATSLGVNGISNGAQAGVAGFSAQGYGGRFERGAAAIRLIPTGSIGAPTSGAHAVGESVVDQDGTLFICVAAGAPGTWKQVVVAGH